MLLHGPNGAGKTNLLEALHVGTQAFSPRARQDATLIRFGADGARVALAGSVAGARFATDIRLSRAAARQVELNGDRLLSAERLRHELATLVFTPDRLAVVKGGPAARRAYLDRGTGRLTPARSTLATDYANAVAQRNAGLRRARAGLSGRDAISPWTRNVAELGDALVAARVATIDILAPAFSDAAGELGLEDATLSYEGDAPTIAELEGRFDADLERGTTGLGPHLPDLAIAAAGRDLRTVGSQGEQRVAVLALVLAEAAALRDRTGSSPLVLLDDVLSELDGSRRRSLAEMISRGSQTVVTATATAALPVEPALAIAVSPGAATV